MSSTPSPLIRSLTVSGTTLTLVSLFNSINPCSSLSALQSLVSYPSLSCTIASAPPSIPPTIPHTSAHLTRNTSQHASDSVSSGHSYFLRSISHLTPLPVLGIGSGTSTNPPRTRGRPSALARAIKRTNLEVKAGIQSSIIRVLRARKPNSGVSQ